MSITITVPNDDHVALRAMAKALEEIAVARGAPAQGVQVTMGPICTVPMSPEQEDFLREKLARIKDNVTRAKADGADPISQEVRAAQVDTISQQVESLAIPVEANGATYETDLGSDKPEAVCVADSTGTPWDERIHSASKALNSDGTWRLRRKPKDMTDDEWTMYVNDVKVEISESQRESDEDDDTLQSPLYEVCPGHIGVMETEPPVAAEGDNSETQRESEELCIDEGCNHHGTPHVCITPEPPVAAKGDDFHVDAGEVTEQQIASIPVPPLPPVPQVEEKTAPDGHEYAHMTFPQVMQFLTERHDRITSAQVDDIIADMGLNSIMDLNTQPQYTGPFIARVKALLGE